MAERLAFADLYEAIEQGGGWGYSTIRSTFASTEINGSVDQLVVNQANLLGLTKAEFAAWVDSKLGRWLVDELSGVDFGSSSFSLVVLGLVQKYLNRKSVDGLVEAGISSPGGI